ncbi:hypothetical protein LPJ56_006306 [Coemansia sp. RSA 2599]|nr:hypothetical protein LPJ75_006331 [Coemansia sp. RSA 2598]KAJ1806974.1 hypothetical protein LPJ56_006306 [Coemansia sp. RSA 2599]
MNRYLSVVLLFLAAFMGMLVCNVTAVDSDGLLETIPATDAPANGDQSSAPASTMATMAEKGSELDSSGTMANALPFDNLAANLPEAFSALENQFADAEFQAMLTSQLNNPNAVEMFQSLIHDSKAINSISSLLDDPRIQSSLSEQFVQEYLAPTGAMSTTPMETSGVNSGVFGGLGIKKNIESESKHTSLASATRPRALVVGMLLYAVFSMLTPI